MFHRLVSVIVTLTATWSSIIPKGLRWKKKKKTRRHKRTIRQNEVCFLLLPSPLKRPQEAPSHPHTGLPSSLGAHTRCGHYHLGAGEAGELAHRLGPCVPGGS